MSRRAYERWTIVGMVLTACIFVGHFFLPDRREYVHPLETNLQRLYGYYDIETGESVSWQDRENHDWVCDFKVNHNYGCGWYAYWDPEFVKGIDLQPFDRIEVSLRYDGPADRIRLFMSNFEPAFSYPNDVVSSKFLSMTFSVLQVGEPVVVSLPEFSVANWWLQERKIRRHWAVPAFDNIVRIGLDVMQPGRHQVGVDSIVLVGRWIRTEALTYAILAFWALLFVTEGVIRCWRNYRKRWRERQMIDQLERRKKGQEEERQRLALLTEVDPLTGIYNRSGLGAHLATLFDGSAQASTGVVLIDLDNFRQLNDRWGHDMGDKVLKAFATALSASLRSDDTVARWAGGEFIVICRKQSAGSVFAFAEKLRQMAGAYRFGGDLNLSLTISIGVTITCEGDSFEDAFHRAEQALHLAKQRGRNRVELAAANSG